MIEITVGYVAGIIAAAIVVAQVWCPTAVALILAGLLRDTETAATWNIASRIFQRTWWPTILQSDSVQSFGARRNITIISWTVPIIAFLIAAAGVITPLGLYEELVTLQPKLTPFSYVKDTGSFGIATSQRGHHNFSRTCTQGQGFLYQIPAPCPYSDNTVIVITNTSRNMTYEIPGGYSSKIDPIAKEIFSSGTKNRSTVSNFFDIEWRQLTKTTLAQVDNGTEVSVGAYSQLESHIMDPTVKVVEGLVVDATNGGIGFRNHTIPANVELGASWSEDLLFVEPIASCVNLNLTLDFEINYTASIFYSFDKLRLTDRGGFVNLNHTYPYYDREHAQSNPELKARAYKAGVLNNFYTMAYLNVTTMTNATAGTKAFSYLDSHLGKEFPLEQGSFKYRGLGLKSTYGNYLQISNSVSPNNKVVNWTNPFGISSSDFQTAELVCTGAGAADIANISTIYVGCGLLRGAPQRVDGGNKLAMYENHSKWSSPLHSCATAIRAIVKTVTFTVNGTDGLNSLKVTSIEPKHYDSPEDYPLWATENSGLTMDGIMPIWGIISPEYASRPNISTVRKPEFHLPGKYGTLSISSLENTFGLTRYNIPGSDFPSSIMKLLFTDSLSDGAFDQAWPFDLAGVSNIPIFERWQALSPDADRVSDIIKLLWTDLAASAVVGTKGTLGSGNNVADEAARIHVSPFGRRIKYHVLFGIPAFILLLVMLSILLLLVVTTVSHSSTVRLLRHRIQQLTVGRVFTTFLFQNDSNMYMPSKEWSRANGRKAIYLGGLPENAVVVEDERPTQSKPGTPAEEVNVALMKGETKPGHET
ncbi:hypothetical protein CGCTS75_v006389 [Colletotrichum tropicale]|nr:hypothetical protein CGCTS75_v006389 [Colletotrichum tropicale]